MTNGTQMYVTNMLKLFLSHLHSVGRLEYGAQAACGSGNAVSGKLNLKIRCRRGYTYTAEQVNEFWHAFVLAADLKTLGDTHRIHTS